MSSKRIPKYRLHKSTGRAVVTLDGRDFYLGRHGSQASREKYERLTGEWLANGRRLPASDPPAATTVARLMADFLDHADRYYRKNGKPTKEVTNLDEALRPVAVRYASCKVTEFTPPALKSVRDEMIRQGLARTTINARINRIRRMFKWGVAEGLVPSGVLEALRAVDGLRYGRSPAPEPEPVRPVAEADVRAVDELLPPPVRAMVWLQWWAGMRPGEVVIMRTGDIDTTGKVWLFRPEHHKTEHHGIERLVPLGPQAQVILRPWLRADPRAYLFSPSEAEETRRREGREQRKTPLTPSQRRRQRKRNPKRRPGRRYTTATFGRAVRRACERHNGIAEEKGEHQIEVWSPNQLRHACATRLRSAHNVEAARIILGHTSVTTTEIYAEVDRDKALRIMEDVG